MGKLRSNKAHHTVANVSTEKYMKPLDELLFKLKYSSIWWKICFASCCWVFSPQPRRKTINSVKKPSLMYLCHLGVNTSPSAVQVHEKTLGSPAEVVQPSATKAPWDFYFGCAWENVKSTLRSPTSILPLLSPTLIETVPKLEWKAHFASSSKQQSTQKPLQGLLSIPVLCFMKRQYALNTTWTCWLRI